MPSTHGGHCPFPYAVIISVLNLLHHSCTVLEADFVGCSHLSEEQIDIFHQILDCVSDTAAAEMRAAYKVGFKDGATMM